MIYKGFKKENVNIIIHKKYFYWALNIELMWYLSEQSNANLMQTLKHIHCYDTHNTCNTVYVVNRTQGANFF